MDEEFLQEGVPMVFDVLHASSYPGAKAPPRRRPEPPKAPLRRPTEMDIEVPPLHLPEVPRKRRSLTGSTASLGTQPASDDGGCMASTQAPHDEQGIYGIDGEDEDEEDEEGIFALDGPPRDPQDEESDDDFFPSYGTYGLQMHLTGFDEPLEAPKTRAMSEASGQDFVLGASEQRTQRSGSDGTSSTRLTPPVGFTGSTSPKLGASPVLLSALEQVAAEAEILERMRRGTM